MSNSSVESKIPVGISTCLLGEPVRYNGGHKKSSYCVDTLSDYFDFQGFCPEMAIGLGVPRETIRVVINRETDALRVENQTIGVDHRPALREFAETVVAQNTHLCGYIVMKDSPSCGMERVKRFNEKGNMQDTRGRGAFTERLIETWPWLPVEESGRLNDPNLRENFVLRVMALHDFNTSVEAQLSAKALIDFHARYKYILMAHSQVTYKALGRLLSSLKQVDLTAVATSFKQQFMLALAKPAGRKGNSNALMHIQGYLKRDLNSHDKQRLSAVISQYRRGEIPLSVPTTLIAFLLEQYPNEYVLSQRYLHPYPDQLGLRNAI